MLKATKGVSLLKFLCKYVDRNVLDLSYKMMTMVMSYSIVKGWI